jgi:hypothetical protein
MSEVEFRKCSCHHCGGHIEFPANGEGATVQCPHCGEKTRLSSTVENEVLQDEDSTAAINESRSRTAFGVIGSVILVLSIGAVAWWFLVGRSKMGRPRIVPASITPGQLVLRAESNLDSRSVTTGAQASPTASATKSLDDLKVGSITLEKTKGTRLVHAVGLLKNDSAYQRFGVKIELELTDAKGNKVGTARDYRAVLDPNQAWQFRALVLDNRAAAARVVSIEEDR